jgi:hypothetical protein
MAKYRVKTDAVHPYRTGDIVEFKDPLVDGFKAHFEEYDGDEEVTDIAARNPLNDPSAANTQLDLGGKLPGGGERQEGENHPQFVGDGESNLGNGGGEGSGSGSQQPVVNPSREELKERAKELGIDFAPNITTERLLEMVRAKEAENQE